MEPIFLDYETFYDNEYSLRRMTPAEYILDPRFECIGCAVQEGLEESGYWIDGKDLQDYFNSLPEKCWFVSHNALFDACITAWKYGKVGALTTCTLATSRAIMQHKLRDLSLGSVAKELGLGVKGDTVHKVKGMGLEAIKAAGLYHEYVRYSIQDVKLCAGIFKELVWSGQLPIEEVILQDIVMRATIQPVFELDVNVLAQHLAEVKANKQALLDEAGVHGDDIGQLRSDATFAAMLEELGVDPPRKVSARTGKEAWAFSKTDGAFLDLLDHETPEVQALVAARIGHKTTLEEKRTERFISMSRLVYPDGIGLMPMPMRYAGAHTHRLSGDWKLNVQNLPRGGKLRQALRAPKGHVVLTVDASQIEARLTAWLAQEKELLQQFADGADVYSNFATEVFGKTITKQDVEERFVGKQAVLGLGFGLGWNKFQKRIKTDSIRMIGTAIELDDKQAMNIVELYRNKYQNIPEAWKFLQIDVMNVLDLDGRAEFGPCIITKGIINLPNVGGNSHGLKLYYHDLKRDKEGQWVFTYGGKPQKLYGGKLMENIVQALDRVIVMGAALRIQKLIYPYRLAQQAHDENCYVVREADADAVKQILKEEMTRRPPWAPDLPLAAEVGEGATYGDAK